MPVTNFAIHKNFFKYWFTLWHFAMDDPALHTYNIVTDDGGYTAMYCSPLTDLTTER